MTDAVELIAAPNDAVAVGRIERLLTDSGFSIQAFDDQSSREDVFGSTVVVIVSRAALMDPSWRARLSQRVDCRLVPIVVDDIDDDAVPERIREITWIRLTGDSSAEYGQVLSALRHDPAEHRLAVQLKHEAAAWSRSGDHSLLADEPSRIGDLQRVLHEDPSARLVPLDDDEMLFIAVSLEAARRRRRKSRRRRLYLVAVVGLALVALVVAIIAVRDQLRSDSAAGVAAFASLERDNPRWAALNAAGVLTQGDVGLKAGAAELLRRLLVEPWSDQGTYMSEGTIEDIALGPDDSWMAVLNHRPDASDRIIRTEVRTGSQAVLAELPNLSWAMALSDDGASAVVTGPEGAVAVDLATGAVQPISSELSRRPVALGRDRVLLVHDESVSIISAGGTLESRYEFEALPIAVARLDNGDARILLRSDDELRLVDPHGGVVEAVVTVEDSFVAFGGIGRDGRTIFHTGPERQLWVHSEGRSVPTGIPLVDNVRRIVDLGDDVVLVGSAALGERVYHLGTGLEIGHVCRDVPSTFHVNVGLASGRIACVGTRTNATWDLPAGPLARDFAADSPDPDDRLVMEANTLTVRLSDGFLRIDPGIGRLTAAQVHPSGAFIAVGADDGRVALLDVFETGLEVASRWQTPDRSSVVEIAWSNGMIATTEVASWQVPICPGCSVPEILLGAFVGRSAGCYQETHLRFIGSASRDALMLPVCEAPL